MVDFTQQLAKRIRDARKSRHLTQKDLANLLGRTAASISDLERGKVQVSAADLKMIADYLEKPIEYFYGEDFGGKDVEDLIALLRMMDPDIREKVLPTTQAMANMQNIVIAIHSTDPNDEQALLELTKAFYADMQPFLENVGDIYKQGRDLNEKLSKLFNDTY